MSERPPFGPWSPACTDQHERACQLRSLAVLVHVMRMPGAFDPAATVIALRRAESGDQHALGDARRMFDLMPALHQRRIISAFGAVTWGCPKVERGAA
jgi:hypothetical protein